MEILDSSYRYVGWGWGLRECTVSRGRHGGKQIRKLRKLPQLHIGSMLYVKVCELISDSNNIDIVAVLFLFEGKAKKRSYIIMLYGRNVVLTKIRCSIVWRFLYWIIVVQTEDVKIWWRSLFLFLLHISLQRSWGIPGSFFFPISSKASRLLMATSIHYRVDGVSGAVSRAFWFLKWKTFPSTRIFIRESVAHKTSGKK